MSPRQHPPPSSPGRALKERLRTGAGQWISLEAFAPLPHCLGWQLSREYWNLRGPSAFFGGEIPYAAINDGCLSADAAQFFVELCARKDGRSVRILEVGGGSGLFAKLFLAELRIRAPALYKATTYLWTDASPTMVQKVKSDGVFASHAGRIRTTVLQLPGMAALGREVDEGFDLIIANYVLDNLPATVLRLSNNRIEELEVRATLRADLEPARLGGRTAQEWGEHRKTGGAPVAELVELSPWFSLECRHRAVDRAAFKFGSLIPEAIDGGPLHWSHHETAWTWLRECLPLVRAGGGLLVNDYGHYPLQQRDRRDALQHFGGSLANGINFDELNLLSRLEPQWQVVAPKTDARQLHSRWITRREDALSTESFSQIFDGRRRNVVIDLLKQAENRADEGRTEEARWLIWEAHERAPRCWHVLERWASFCFARLRDFQSAHDLAVEGLSLHPSHPGLWNVKGDALYEQKNYTGAENCYRRAIEIHPREIRGRLNLAYVHLELGRHADALAVLAEALALDKEGNYRDALLEKQRQVLAQLSKDAHDIRTQQLNRFRNLDAPAVVASGEANRSTRRKRAGS